jgi:hypothetical protein
VVSKQLGRALDSLLAPSIMATSRVGQLSSL